MSKKIELFKKGEVANWQLDDNDKSKVKEFSQNKLISYKKICFKETNNIINNKQKYGYYLNRLISEYVRMKNINAVDNKNKLKQFCQKEGKIVTDYFRQMGEICAKIDEYIINDTGDKGLDHNINNKQKENIEEKEQMIKENNEEYKNEENKNEIIANENEVKDKNDENKNEIKENNDENNENIINEEKKI